ncbi:GntR family transcriptional regulator [Sphaerochaeta sp. PS]|uniref:GntR family transcriptional regulator n=1 Tax=Sphaerochaeta sp. PS TaxID=3076336 RepID=UPI0028A4EC38|nr:GntR family transcriptional regulator [Sphaerochaeta sp. PS]MDT4763089.1 GntR family transcriptional regulator [Sphaerochaeta sp. PS]
MQNELQSNNLFQTAAEKAYETISKKIIENEYKPGMRLVRRKLAEELGMSPIPILEAMKRLEQDGLIEYKAHWGSIVTIPTIERVMDMFALREALECQVARIIAVKATAEQGQNLRLIAEELDRLRFEQADAAKITEYHLKFHMTMAEYTGFNSLISGLHKLNFNWLLFKAVLTRRSQSALQRYWHVKLLDNILGKDPDDAEKAMREHVYDAYKPFLEDIELHKKPLE